MTLHGPCTLEGPVTRDCPWWAQHKRKPRKRRTAGVRADLVARVKQQIADGTYDTPQRWEAALDQLAKTIRLP
jgi:hypothetical protein